MYPQYSNNMIILKMQKEKRIISFMVITITKNIMGITSQNQDRY
jgi:hypothetical protein